MLKYLLAIPALVLGISTAEARVENFKDGFNNLPSTHWMAGRDVIPIPYPAKWQVWYNDFQSYTAGDWVVNQTEAGGGDASEAVTDLAFGNLLITCDNADNDNDFLQSVGEIFDITAGKKVYFETRFKLNEVLQADFVLGLQIRDTTPLAVSDGVFFMKDDGDAILDIHSFSSSVGSSATGLYTMVADTFLTVAFYYDGASNITVAVDNVVVGQLAAVTPSGTEMTLSIGLQQGEVTNIKTMTIDYVMVAFER